jgi:hypothetical protein
MITGLWTITACDPAGNDWFVSNKLNLRFNIMMADRLHGEIALMIWSYQIKGERG